MKHSNIILTMNNVDKNNLSTFFHLYEIGLFLSDNGFNVLLLLPYCNMILELDLKYMIKLPILLEEEAIPKNSLIISTEIPNFLYKLDKIKKYFFLNNPQLYTSIQNNLSVWHSIKNNTNILYSTVLENCFLSADIEYSLLENNQMIEYTYGLYTKYLLNTYRNTNKWYFEKEQITDITMDRINFWLEQHHLPYVSETNCFAVHNNYQGLLYGNCVDYFTRLPFEFSLANKKVIMFDCDPSFRKMTKHQLWHYPYIIEDIPNLNMDLNIFKNN